MTHVSRYRLTRLLTLTGMVAVAGLSPATPAAAALTGDYPTDATVDYVFGCMQSNGNSEQALQRCSCSFDVVASIVPYDRYVEASTFLSMRQVPGEKGALFRSSAESKSSVGDLKRAQAEAEIRCFE